MTTARTAGTAARSTRTAVRSISGAAPSPTATSPGVGGAPFDPSFGNGGIARHPVRGRVVDMVALPSGGLVVLTDAVAATMTITGLLADGRLDPSFGTGGVTRVGGFDQPVFARAMTVQADGRILAAGIAAPPGPRRIAITRLTSDGRIDPSFSGDGLLTLTFPDADNALDVAAVVTQPDGRIVVVGTAIARPTSPGRLVAARFRPDGSLDLSYGVVGRADITLPGALARTTAAALDAAGNLLVGGHTFMADTESDMLAVRVRPDGSPDPGFGVGGLVITDFGVGNDSTSGVVIQPDGRIVLAGTTQTGPMSSRAAALRLLQDGSLDPDFGTGGRVSFDVGLAPGVRVGRAVALMPDGRFFVAGTADESDSEIARPFVGVLTAAGVPDGRFDAGDGIVLPHLVGETGETGGAVAVQADGRPVAAFGADPTKRLAVLRFLPTTETAELSLTLGADTFSAGPGPLAFVATVRNAGPLAAHGVRLRIRASKAISVPEPTQGAAVLDGTRVGATCELKTVPAGGEVTVTFRTTVTGFEGAIDVNAVLTAATPDRDGSDNDRSVQVLTSPLATQ